MQTNELNCVFWLNSEIPLGESNNRQEPKMIYSLFINNKANITQKILQSKEI
jgi:hypothetical protein